jgi:phospholipid transport system substrate-binding protein
MGALGKGGDKVRSCHCRRKWGGVVLPVALLLSIYSAALAGEPTELIRQSTDRILQVLKDPKLKDRSKAGERRKMLRKIADERFDWEEMAKRSLSIYWAERTPEERKEFVSLFSDLLERSYMGKIEAYKNEKILYQGEKIEGDYATVDTVIVTEREVEVPISYRMRKKGDQWLIFDVSIEGVSLVNNYRNQFARILSSSSYSELIRRMKTKQIQQVAPARASE